MLVCVLLEIVSRVVSDPRFCGGCSTNVKFIPPQMFVRMCTIPTNFTIAAHLAMARVSLLLWVLVGVLAITAGAWFGVERVLFSTPLTHYEVCVCV